MQYNLEKCYLNSINQYDNLIKQNHPIEKKKHFQKHLNTILSIKEVIETELIGLNEFSKITLLNQTIDNEKDVIKKTIKWLKNENISQKDKKLIAFQNLKEEFNLLKKNIVNKSEILQNRENLYQTKELSSKPTFPSRIEDLTKNHPELKENCEHLKHVLNIQTRIEKSSLCEKDINDLKVFHNKIKDVDEEFATLIQREVTILERCFSNKATLLINYASSIRQNVPFGEWTVEEKIQFYVQIHQILNNPFEPPIDVNNLLNHILRTNTHSATRTLCQIIYSEYSKSPSNLKNSFWDTIPEFERRAHLLADDPKKKEFLFKAHLNGLKTLLKEVKSNNFYTGTNLIIGGGPSGLIHGLLLSFTGHDFRIIEKRDATAKSRTNVITLGKDIPLDLSILYFLGVIPGLEKDQKASFGHLKKHYIEVSIGDLEQYLKIIYQNLNLDKKIEYNKQVTNIENDNNHAKVFVSL